MTPEHQRPNPDALLAQVQAEEQERTRGKLKIFLGYAAGVGKTYAMLEAAHERLEEGVDVVVGYIEIHGRAETEKVLQGLEVLPRKRILYRGLQIEEPDTDLILRRRPQLVLVDELAHTNPPESRHPKRYQDVEELLSAGIDVYTTVNIQHLESLNDVVLQITGVQVRETIPDRLIDQASEIEVIDLPPLELLARLREGKVYIPEQARQAMDKFFRQGNLTALREISLRRTAARVDTQMRTYMRREAIAGPWPASERLLVAISPHTSSEQLVRTASRLAEETHAEWFAVVVETPRSASLSRDRQAQVQRTLRLAEELGARVKMLSGNSVAEALVQYAQKHNVSKIVVGSAPHPRWKEILFGTATQQIIRLAGTIDVYVISQHGHVPESPREAPQTRAKRVLRLRPYLGGLVLVALATLLSWVLHNNLSLINLMVLYLVAVVLAAFFQGRGPAILASLLSMLTFNFFFVPPQMTFRVSDPEYLLTFLGFLVVGIVISTLASRVRKQVETARRREENTAALYALSRDLAASSTKEAVNQAVLHNISQTFSRATALLIPAKGVLRVSAQSQGFLFEPNEMAVAGWAFEQRKPAGRGTEMLPSARGYYLPMVTAQGTWGVLGVQPPDPEDLLDAEQRGLLSAFANQTALAVERVELAEVAGRNQVLEATEKLERALLNSISHDLRTPLVSITGVLTTLEENDHLEEETQRKLVMAAREEADRLNRLVGNLLDMTRIEAGAIRLYPEPTDLEDLVGAALEQLRERLGQRPVTVQVPENLPLVPLDYPLMVQVLVNVIDNALKYSPPDQPVEISAYQTGTEVAIEVADRGAGIPLEDLSRVFDKFYRVQRPDSVSGTGLGLSICKGITEAHGGRIEAVNREGGGTVVTVYLPLETAVGEEKVNPPAEAVDVRPAAVAREESK
jgi:two-component system sensor histidine kinase KdpD